MLKNYQRSGRNTSIRLEILKRISLGRNHDGFTSFLLDSRSGDRRDPRLQHWLCCLASNPPVTLQNYTTWRRLATSASAKPAPTMMDPIQAAPSAAADPVEGSVTETGGTDGFVVGGKVVTVVTGEHAPL